LLKKSSSSSSSVIYHVEFHTIRLWDMKSGDYSGWAHPDHNQLSCIVFMHSLPPPSVTTQSFTKAPSSKAKKTPSLPVEQQVCYDWNDG
jgi:hypothetical protein